MHKIIIFAAIAFWVSQGLRKSLETADRRPFLDFLLSKFWIAAAVFVVLGIIPQTSFMGEWLKTFAFIFFAAIVFMMRELKAARLFAGALFPTGLVFCVKTFFWFFTPDFYEKHVETLDDAFQFSKLWLFGFGIYAFVQSKKERAIRAKELAEKQEAEARKKELETLVADRTHELSEQKTDLEKALSELRATQNQLIQSEKLASLGELTAGIAHEIQNPLNFVNNFSELSIELAEDLKSELKKEQPDQSFINELMNDLQQNQQKINHHGKRAASIVTGMLQHARTSSGKKEPTDLNALADEFLRLSYHGLRAKDSTFNAKIETDFDPKIGRVEVIPQDLGRVFLNLINNAFYAAAQRKKAALEPFEPTVWVSTKLKKASIEIRVRDNGNGIPDDVRAKIFQPFFTTKPTGEGTGLGLSLAYDIIKKGHGGSLEVASEIGKGTEFSVILPF